MAMKLKATGNLLKMSFKPGNDGTLLGLGNLLLGFEQELADTGQGRDPELSHNFQIVIQVLNFD
jgi:hypothetical protein